MEAQLETTSSVKEETKEGHHVTTITTEHSSKAGTPTDLTPENYALLAAENQKLKQELENLQQFIESPSGPLNGAVQRVSHYSRIVNDAEAAKDFYVRVLGCKVLNRPHLPVPGYWLWLGNIQLHLIEKKHDPISKLMGGKGIVNHLSFETTNIEEVENRLHEDGISFVRNVIPEGEATIEQLFFCDPDNYYCEVCTCADMNDFIFNKSPPKEDDDKFASYNDDVEIQGDALALLVGLDWSIGNKCSTEEEYNQLLLRLKRAYTLVAQNADVVSKEGLVLLFQKLGSKVTAQQIDELSKELGIELNNCLQFPDVLKMLVTLVTRQEKEPTMEEVKDAFSIYDKDGSGFINKNEIMSVVFGLGLPVDESDLDQKLKQFDVNGDNNISIEEFAKHLDALKQKLN